MNDSLPQAFLKTIESLHISNAYFGKRPTTFRINTLKSTSKKVDFETTSVPWYRDAFLIKQLTLRELTEMEIYKRGEIYVQSLSSMIPALILDPLPGERILDLCAAPGSKTTQMAALMNNLGSIVANDTSHIRRYRLAANVQMQGATNVLLEKEDGRGVWKKYPEYFDRVLADVPCSMEGRFDADNPKTYQDWSPKKVKILAQMQKWLLRSAVSATKPGGTIVYSTCTLNQEENEEVVDWIVKKEQGNVVTEEVSLKNFTFDAPGRIYPSTSMEGFFIAKLKKIKSSVPKTII